MRIAYVVGRFPVISEPFILNQITGAVSRGHEVDIYALQGPPPAGSKVHPDVDRFKLMARTVYPPAPPESKRIRPLVTAGRIAAMVPTDPVRALKLTRLWRTSERPPWKLLLRGSAMAGKKPYDVIHCQFGFFGTQLLRLRDAGIIDGTIITTFRGSDISRYVAEQGKDVYKELFARGDLFLANCEFFRRRAIELGCCPERIRVHGSGIDLSRFVFRQRTLPNSGPIRIATTGRLVEKKGIEYVIRAVAQLANSGRSVRYSIIGDGPLRGSLEGLIHALGCSEHVEILGWKDQHEVIQILDQCQLFVASSLTAHNGDQDAPVNTLKEAMAMGLPVVASDHGGIPELVEHGKSGFLVPERDAPAIARALYQLIDLSSLWPQMGAAGRTTVERLYDIDKLNDELIALYQTLRRKPRRDVSTEAIPRLEG